MRSDSSSVTAPAYWPLCEEAEPVCHPRASNLFVRLLEPADRSLGGIIYCDNHKENYEEAQVVATGPGYALPTPWGFRHTVMWAEEGDRIFFRQKDLRWVDRDQRLVCARDEDLLAIVEDDGGLRALNGWVLLEPGDRKEQTAGGILIAEGSRRREDWGRILDVGPGTLVRNSRSPAYGTRMPICAILGIEEPLGKKVYFDRSAEVLEVGRGVVASWLVQATELCAIEE